MSDYLSKKDIDELPITTLDDRLDNAIPWELVEAGYKHKYTRPAVYLIAILLFGKWRLKVGQCKNFKERLRTINNNHKIYVQQFYDKDEGIPRIIPLAVCFTGDKTEQDNIEKAIKDYAKAKKLLIPDTDIFGEELTEFCVMSAKIYDKFKKACLKLSKSTFWESEIYIIDDSNVFSYDYNGKFLIFKDEVDDSDDEVSIESDDDPCDSDYTVSDDE